uniref:nuclear receptor subfamily 6 group A member 1 n=1 Tax=Myxine glutinosa TaxID=7769 RepID=UPI00358E9DA6
MEHDAQFMQTTDGATFALPAPLTPLSSPLTPTAEPQDHKPPSSPLRLCLICGDRATGLHYGIVSCEGCKGFFKRSICNRRVYRCARGRSCAMSRRQRNRCQYCRLLKCLSMGMNRKAIREDGMPGGRNKSIGPVQISADEIERIMTGQEFDDDSPSSGPSSMLLDNAFMGSTVGGEGYTGYGYHGDGYSMSGDGAENTCVGGEGVLGARPSPAPTPSSGRIPDGNGGGIGLTPLRAPPPPPTLNQGGVIHPSPCPRPPHPPSTITPLPPPSPPHPLVAQILAAEEPEPLVPPLQPPTGGVSRTEVLSAICGLADAWLARQARWLRRLPLYAELRPGELSRLLAAAWPQLLLLSSLSPPPTPPLAGLSAWLQGYSPSPQHLATFPEEGMAVAERLVFILRRTSALRLSPEELACMKVIALLNQEVPGLGAVASINKRYWMLCQEFIEGRQGGGGGGMPGVRGATTVGGRPSPRFPDLMVCLPEIRYVAAKMVSIPLEQLPVMLKAVLHSCKPRPLAD